MIYITGNEGFIGKNLCNYLDTKKIKYKKLKKQKINKNDILIHLGATTNTMASAEECMKNNYLYSIKLFDKFFNVGGKIIFASSASIYGNNGSPLNHYAFSKKFCEDYLNGRGVSLRFFNVYGNHEEHKCEMKSFISKLLNRKNNLFKGTEKYSRDYIYVKDICKVIHFFINNYVEGVYDVGTGKTVTYEKLFKILDVEPKIVPLPKELKNKLQNNTKANIKKLREIGYKENFYNIETALEDMKNENCSKRLGQRRMDSKQ